MIEDAVESQEQRQAAAGGPAPGYPLGWGYEPSRSRTVPQAAGRSQPPRHRPKGRLLIGGVLIAVLGCIAWTVWTSFFRYRAWGVVAGRIIEVSPPVEGLVQFVHVREGDRVRQGKLLATLHDPQAIWRLERAADELRLARAELASLVAQLRWEMAVQGLENTRATAEFYEAWGRLRQEAAREKLFASELERTRALHADRAVTGHELDRAVWNERGQREKLQKLKDALAAWKQRAEGAEGSPSVLSDRIEPAVVRVETLQNELQRARRQIKQGEVRSPVNGVVVEWHRRAGERAALSEPLLSLLEEGSGEIELYLTQHQADLLRLGDEIELETAPLSETVVCRVLRVGERLREPPAQITRRYAAHEKLLPVHLEVVEPLAASRRLRPGMVVRLPRWW